MGVNTRENKTYADDLIRLIRGQSKSPNLMLHKSPLLGQVEFRRRTKTLEKIPAI